MSCCYIYCYTVPWQVRDCKIRQTFRDDVSRDDELLSFIKMTDRECHELGDPDKGSVILTGRLFADRAIYTCEEGYRLVGVEFRLCQADGSWSATEPSCHKMGMFHYKCNRSYPNYHVRSTVCAWQLVCFESRHFLTLIHARMEIESLSINKRK